MALKALKEAHWERASLQSSWQISTGMCYACYACYAAYALHARHHLGDRGAFHHVTHVGDPFCSVLAQEDQEDRSEL